VLLAAVPALSSIRGSRPTERPDDVVLLVAEDQGDPCEVEDNGKGKIEPKDKAACKASIQEAMHAVDATADCSGDGDNCVDARCCRYPGMQCYAKHSGLARCRLDCFPGPDPSDADSKRWSCDRLGPRTPGVPLQRYAVAKPSRWVGSFCSRAGSNCHGARCCAAPGLQCFRKNETFAACRPGCTPGPDPSDEDHHPWNCERLGFRTPGQAEAPPRPKAEVPGWVRSRCVKPGEDCSDARCCAAPGLQCFEKDPGWASCRPHCTPGAPDPGDVEPKPWSCRPLGGRTPGDPPASSNNDEVPQWVASHCSKAGDDCSASKCCADPGLQCYRKNTKWASCKASCVPGPDVTDTYRDPWSCGKVGSRTPGKALPPPDDLKLPGWVDEHCSHPGDDCSLSMCCAWAGMQCYEKNDNWATCKSSCFPGAPDMTDVNSEPWSCRKVGALTPGRSAVSTPDMEAARWVASKCSKPASNCMHTRCCAWAGMQCFEKNKDWATCRIECTAGRDPTDPSPDPWTCKPLGPQTPGRGLELSLEKAEVAGWVASTCAKGGENCVHAQCCRGRGLQCYEKEGGWGMCKAGCFPGAPDTTDVDPHFWSCRKIGGRTPGKVPKALSNLKPPNWVDSKCSAGPDDCSKTRCCKEEGMQCFQKNLYWASCKFHCSEGVDPTGTDKEPWSCKALGPRTPKPWGFPSMFCFSVMRDTGYEVDLVKTQLAAGAGIFACDEAAILCDHAFSLDGLEAVTFQGASVGVSKDNTAANTELFINVWNAVKDDGRVQKLDWTVKVDPDAVLLPDRLRNHLAPHRDANTYIVNCDKPMMKPMMFGALEALSKKAMETYYAGRDRCQQDLDWRDWGEDYFLGNCLQHLGVKPVHDYSIYSDGVCTGLDCNDKRAAAFHPLKTADTWLKCFNEATAT